ncbi:TrbI/VirB10 family protein [Rubrivivax albus]|uniref:Conjugal transfer protein TraB n=1 Tax=Rubrivivax albus TaxID=2499835 RepID=A0A437JMG7_9BURK|nr:TrbI/VirB10 family protein [Rubrivivax albus]RVT47994.1 conjugal transfer protein TraB [Rubrivivax albus]
MSAPLSGWRQAMSPLLQRLTPRQQQYALLVAILAAGIGVLWIVFASADQEASGVSAPGKPSGTVTRLGVMSPGQQVDPLDHWLGTAGNKLAQYEQERDARRRHDQDRQAFEARTLQRFNELERRLTAAAQVNAAAAPDAASAPVVKTTDAQVPDGFPPASALPVAPRPQGTPPGNLAVPPLPTLDPRSGGSGSWPAAAPPRITRVRVHEPEQRSSSTGVPSGTPSEVMGRPSRTVSTWLPVSFTRGTLLGGLDAPTGGQAQSNPHPVLIRLSDNAVLPNRFRGEYRECFVIAAGYGDISSERAYLRTENLSCVRADGATLEVKIQGSVYGEDGKVGMRGRLVTKQGQMLANALLAGVVSGIGQGLATSSTNVSTSPLGTITSASGADAYRAGLGTGVGRALDRLAQYYIKLAENTFPVIEVDAGREIDVVITKGVRIDVPMSATAAAPLAVRPSNPEVPDDAND